jgi:hypothetical protein
MPLALVARHPTFGRLPMVVATTHQAARPPPTEWLASYCSLDSLVHLRTFSPHKR